MSVCSATQPTPIRVVALVDRADSSVDDLLAPIKEHAELAIAHDQASLDRVVADANALFVWENLSGLMDRAIARAPGLRWIHSSSVGVEALITPALTRSDIVLTNSRGVLDRAIAEYVLGAYLAHRKDFARSLDLQRARQWQHRTTQMVAGTRAVVVGTGSIGRETARLLTAVGVHVTLVGRRANAQDREFGRIAASSDLEIEVGGAQLLVLVAPLTAETRHLLDRDVLERMPDDAYVINVGRGGLVDEPALVAHLSAGRLGGAALDVFETEPLPPQSPLWSDPSVFVSPHMAGDFAGFEAVLVDRFVDLLRDWCGGRTLSHVVDTRLGYVPTDSAPSTER